MSHPVEDQPPPARLSGQVFKMPRHLSSPRFDGRVTAALHARRASAEYVDRSVHVGIIAVSAIDAFKDRLALATSGINGPARRARLRGVGGVYVVQHAAPVGELVFEQSSKKVPALVENYAIKAALPWASLGHRGRYQLFEGDLLVAPSDVGRSFVQPVLPGIGGASVRAGKCEPLIMKSPGSAIFPRQGFLQTRTPPVVPANGARKQHLLATRESDRCCNPAIDPDCPCGDVFRALDIGLADDAPNARTEGDGYRVDLFRQGSSDPKFCAQAIRQAEISPLRVEPSDGAILTLNAERCVALFGPEAREAPRPKECFIGPVQVAQSVFVDAPGRFSQPFNLLPSFGELAALGGPSKSLPRRSPVMAPPITALLERSIVHKASRSGPIIQSLGLRARWIKAKRKCPAGHSIFIVESAPFHKLAAIRKIDPQSLEATSDHE
jgi:hypothetical protein